MKAFVWLAMATSVAMAAPVTVTCISPDGGRTSAECADLATARQRILDLKRQGMFSGPVEVVLADGVHSLTEPLRFTPTDSGTKTAPITYRAEHPGKAVISGGARITGWQAEGNGVWRARVPQVPAGKLYFRQLFVNGRRATRARSPNQGFFHTTGLIKQPEHSHRQADGFYYADDNLTPALAADPDAMVIVYQSWLSRQYRIKSLDPATKAVVLDPQMDVMRVRSRYLVENSRLCLDAPGEWYLDWKKGVVRYVPLPGEDMATTEVVAPVVPSLLQFLGDPEHGAYVEYLHFKGIQFAYADWTPQGRSISGGQARCPMGFEDPDVVLESGAISAIGLRNSSIEGCEIAHVGAHAVTLLQGCRDNLVRQCQMHDLGGGGVYLYWGIPREGKRPSWSPRDDFDHIVHNTIDNCYIHDTTHVFSGSIGVLTGPCAAFNRITHNEICYGDYSGISIGWGWSANQKSGQYQDGNVVEYNHVHHVMNYLLDDGGGIYLLGWQKGARVCHNWIHDVRHDPLGHGAKGIYPDQGTSGVLFEGNIVHDVAQGFGGNGGHECAVRNNIFAFCQKSGIIGGSKWWGDQVRYNPNPVVFEHNIVYEPDAEAMIMRTGYTPTAQVSRENVYWAGPDGASGPLFSGAGQTFVTFADWQAKGNDTGSVMADPLFANAKARDFRLRPGSPALRLGFQQTDRSQIGLYGPRAWTSLPKRTKHAPIAPLPGPGAFTWSYEDEAAGAPPVHSGQLAAGPEELQHQIVVIDTDAATGKHCLKLVEGKNSKRGFFPFLHYPVGIAKGRLKASFHVKLPAATPSAFYFSFRDYDNAGTKYFQTGPYLQVDPKGVLTATDGADVHMSLPMDTWVLVDLTFAVGNGVPKTFDLTVTAPGQPAKTVPGIPFKDAAFRQVGELYLVSTGPDGGAFLIDDVRVSVE
jgi:hypothetical protein